MPGITVDIKRYFVENDCMNVSNRLLCQHMADPFGAAQAGPLYLLSA